MIDNPKTIEAFGFTGENKLWSEIHSLLETSIEAEVSRAIDPMTLGELRAHAAGRAESLRQFKELLALIRFEVCDQMNIRLD